MPTARKVSGIAPNDFDVRTSGMAVKTMNRLYSALAILFSLLSLAGSAAAQETPRELHAALLQAGALDSSLDSFIQPVLSSLLRDAEIEETLEINRPPRPGALSVLVVDVKKLAAVRSDRTTVKRLLSNIANNVLAVPPGTIVFDKEVIAFLTLNAFDDGLQFSQAFRSAEKLGPRASQEAILAVVETFSALADFTRHHMIRNHRQNLDPNKTPTALMPQLVKVFGDEYASKALPMFTMMLAPIVLHEIGHLRRGVAGAYQDALMGPLGAATVSLILQEENAADDFAIERMRRIVTKAVGLRTSSQVGLETQSAIATIKYMRDEVLEDTLSGLRGLNPEDFLINVAWADCNTRKDIEKLPLNNPDRAVFALRDSIPLLTQAEFDGIRSKIQQRIANGTHSHHFTRGDRFLTAITSARQMEPYGLLADSLVFLDAAVRNEPMRLYHDFGTTGTGLSFAEISRRWQDIEVLPAVNCPEGMCAVVQFKNQAGFAEVVGPMSDLRNLRITFPLFGPTAASRDENPEEYFKYAARGLMLLNSVVDSKAIDDRQAKKKEPQKKGPPMDATTALLSKMRMMSLKCGAGFVNTRTDKRMVVMRTLNEKHWVTLEVMPLPANVPPPAGTPKGKRK
jgi:hypothetical protein